MSTCPISAVVASRRDVLAAVIGGTALVTPATAQTNSNAIVGRDGWLFPIWDMPSHRNDPVQLRAVCAFVNNVVGVLKAGRIEVTIGLIPAKARVYRQFLPAAITVSQEFDRRYAITLDELRKPGTAVPDLGTLFSQGAASRTAENLYFRSDTHWTPRGAAIAASETARVIQERFRLPPSTRPGTRLGNVVSLVQGVGDLQRLLPAAERGGFPPEEYRAHEIQPAGGLLDEDGGDVAALGSSLLDPRYQYHPLLSSALSRPVQLAWRPNSVGPYANMLEYVRSEGFKRQRPRVLVWNLLEQDLRNSPQSGAWGRNAISEQAFLTELRQLTGT